MCSLIDMQTHAGRIMANAHAHQKG